MRGVSAEVNRNLPFKYGTRVVSLKVRGVELPYGQMRKLDIEEGRYFSDRDFVDHSRVVILGHVANKRVFQGAPSVGQSVSIGGLDFEVIGVLRNKIQDSSYNGPDNNDGFVPFEVYRDLKNIRDPDLIHHPAHGSGTEQEGAGGGAGSDCAAASLQSERRKSHAGVGHDRRSRHD